MRSKQKAGSDKPKQGAAAGSGGKMANDTNKASAQSPTPKSEGKRTPTSRSDRDDKLGSDNQTRSRKGG